MRKNSPTQKSPDRVGHSASSEEASRNHHRLGRRLTSFGQPPTEQDLPTPTSTLTSNSSAGLANSFEMSCGENYAADTPTTRTATIRKPKAITTTVAVGSGAGAGAHAIAVAVAAPTVEHGNVEERQRRPMPGILRLDMKKPRRSSGGSVEFRGQPQMLGEDVTPPPGLATPHQLSVTWAEECEFNEAGIKYKSMQSNSDEGETAILTEKRKSSTSQDDKFYELGGSLSSPVDELSIYEYHQPHRLPSAEDNDHEEQQRQHHRDEAGDADGDEDEDYSISVSAIMQRRASVRGYRNKRGSRNSRRASSPMDHVLESAEWRRSSVYTTSSEEGTNQESTQEQICENIRLHKEVIQSVKLQPWPMRKKLKLVRQAKTYVARHEGALQERFAMSRSTKDLWARFKILMAARWRHWKRETASFLTVLIPWELRIKEIESHFGSGVASYFTFLRWLMWVNIMIAIPLVAFVIGPEYFATKHDETDPRKKMTDHEYQVAGNLFTIWEFEGYLKYSPMFYGYYSSFSGASSLGYKLPLAYFLTTVVVYIYSFVATLRKMAENSRNSKLSSKDDECTFSWKLFTGWDFMIGHAETAHNRIASVVVGFKEALVEEAEKKKDNRNWRIIMQRILVNILVMGLLAASGCTVVALVNNAEKFARYDNWLSRNAVNVTIALLSFFLPMIFEALGLFENWHPRQQLRLQLARIMILNMLNLYSLMFSFIYQINSKEKPLQKLKITNETATKQYAVLTALIEGIKSATTPAALYLDTLPTTVDETGLSSWGSLLATTTTTTTEALLSTTAAAVYSTAARIKCYNITVKCSKPTRIAHRNLATTTTALLLLNLTTTMLPTTTPTTTDMSDPTTTTAAAAATTTWWTTTEPSTTTLPTSTDGLTTTVRPFIIDDDDDEVKSATATTEFITTSPATTTVELETTYDDYTSSPNSPEAAAATSSQSSTASTTKLPGNDSFFEYYDYFAGLPIDVEAMEAMEEEEHRDAVADADRENTDEKPQQSISRVSRAAVENNGTMHSKYRRRKTNQEALRKSVFGEDYNESASTATQTATVEDTTSPQATTTTTDSSKDFQEHQIEELRKMLAYFTTSTTTGELPAAAEIGSEIMLEPTKAPSTTSRTLPTTTTTTKLDVDNSDERTPYFIDEDIGETIFLNANDLDEEHFEFCIRQVCEPADMFTKSSDAEASTLDPISEVTTPEPTPLELHQRELNEVKMTLKSVQRNLTSMCWETSLGQELSKVIVFDGITLIVATLCMDFLRALFVRYVNQKWCWDMEKTFPQYGDFKIAENILSLIYNQGQVWMGIFFSPGLVIINLVKLVIMMYFRSWIVLTCNVPHEVVFKASKSNNFYLSLLLMMLFLCVLPVGYAIVWLRPSWHCGPFSDYNRISEFITNTTRNALPKQLHEPLEYMTSSSTVIPLLLLLILIIYYLVSLTGALREANQDLRTQLQKEREEERKKMFKVAEAKPAEPNAATLTNRWRKVLEASSPVTPTPPPDFETNEYKNQARKELISRIMKEALRKGSATSDDESMAIRPERDDEDTDTEHQESLPRDEEAKDKMFGLSKLQQIRRTRKPSLVDIVQIAKSERERLASKTPAAREAHPRGRFKVERVENKEADDHDPEINSRIVRERRQSLLGMKQTEDKEMRSVEKPDLNRTKSERRATHHPTINNSNFVVIDEKKSASPAAHETDFKIKLRKPKPKELRVGGHGSAEPKEPIFNFDLPKNMPTEASEPSKRIAESEPITPSSLPVPLQKHPNGEMLANLSRQGRKKIGSLLALVRDAVNNMKSEHDSPSPPTEATAEANNSSNKSGKEQPSHSATTAIEMPPTPELEILATQPHFESMPAATTATPSLPAEPKLAPLEDPEEMDHYEPIPFAARSVSQRHKVMERAPAMRQDSQTSVWSDNIPTITISHTGSQECISETEAAATPTAMATVATAPSTGSVERIIKIDIEDKQQTKA